MKSIFIIGLYFTIIMYVCALTTPPPRKSSKDKLLFTDLYKEEEEIDHELMEEMSRRKNLSSVNQKKVATGVFVGGVYHPPINIHGEDKCNNEELIDLSRPGSLALCTCGVDQVLVNGTCQHYAPGTTIHVENYNMHYTETAVSVFRVRVQDLECSNTSVKHLRFTFDKGMFYLRNRGDVVLSNKAGPFTGLRISDYCVDHKLDQRGALTWTMKACVPYPSVPRCCPPNKIFVEGKCVTGPSPTHYVPPIQADPRGTRGINWPVVANHVNTINCTSESLMTVGLRTRKSYLLALPIGLAYRWFPMSPTERGKYIFCPDFCIDGRQDVDGTIDYRANFCHHGVSGFIKETCKTKSCIQKCCKKGEIMSFDHYRCIKPKHEIPFEPPVKGNKSDFEVIVGRPDCNIHLTELGKVVIDKEGNLKHAEYTLPTKDYCMDSFAHQGITNTQALICPLPTHLTGWKLARIYIFPACYIISLIFLSITTTFYLTTPVLLKQGGWHQLSYVLSLMLAYITSFCINVFDVRGNGCIFLALLMQYGFLSTFFWLCVLSYDIEGKIRSLKHFRGFVPHHTALYIAFGFGGPLCISLVTFFMETVVPYGTPGIIKPSLGISSCWFHSDKELVLYFYGPTAVLFLLNIGLIVSTAWHYHKIKGSALGMMMKSPTETTNTPTSLDYERQKETKKNFSEFKNTFLLLALMGFCWVTELLSYKFPYPEIWAFTDILNCLQGFFFFIIFLANRRNRKILKHRHPSMYSLFTPIKRLFRKLNSFFLKKNPNPNTTATGRSREPSVSSELSDLSDIEPSAS